VLVAVVAAVFIVVVGGDACLGRCGEGTRCEKGRCIAAAAPAPPLTQEAKRRRRHDPGGSASAAAAEVQLKPGDELVVEQGDALGRPEHLDFTKPDERELTDEDIDRVVRGAEGDITRCIADAVGDAPLAAGHVELGLRIEKSGSVGRVRVKAPRLMQRNGLTACLRGVATAMQFPASGGASVYTHAYELK
jgi:hypothetical protein